MWPAAVYTRSNCIKLYSSRFSTDVCGRTACMQYCNTRAPNANALALRTTLWILSGSTCVTYSAYHSNHQKYWTPLSRFSVPEPLYFDVSEPFSVLGPSDTMIERAVGSSVREEDKFDNLILVCKAGFHFRTRWPKRFGCLLGLDRA